MIIVKTKYGKEWIRESKIKKMYKLVSYLSNYSWVSFKQLSEELNISNRSLRDLIFLMVSMRILDYRTKAIKNSQGYKYNIHEVRIKTRRRREDIGLKWLFFYDENGNFLRKKYYSDSAIFKRAMVGKHGDGCK